MFIYILESFFLFLQPLLISSVPLSKAIFISYKTFTQFFPGPFIGYSLHHRQHPLCTPLLFSVVNIILSILFFFCNHSSSVLFFCHCIIYSLILYLPQYFIPLISKAHLIAVCLNASHIPYLPFLNLFPFIFQFLYIVLLFLGSIQLTRFHILTRPLTLV